MEIHFAPMQGHADHIYRRLHAEIFGGIDCYYTPFIRIERHQPRRQDIKHLADSEGDGTVLVPQVIFNSIDELKMLTDAVKELGHKRIDLNMGCPFPMQMNKGRGADMIANIETMKGVADFVNQDTDTTYSIKMRLGRKAPDEWKAIMPILNEMHLAHITLHPRTGEQMYAGDIFADEFDSFAKQSVNPVIWNGDLLTPADINNIAERFPALKGVMIGRGLLGRPSLAKEWREGSEWTTAQRLDKVMAFHDRLLAEYEEALSGQTQILQKIKPFWEYLAPEIGAKTVKAIRKATTLAKYHAALATVHPSLS